MTADVSNTVHETWIARTPDGPLIARRTESRGDFLLDRPTLRKFREPTHLEVANGTPLINGIVMTPMAALPSDLDARVGWYEDDAGRLLLTQIPEAYFGEPMILVGGGAGVSRAYPFGGGNLVTDEGTLIELGDAQIRVIADGGSRRLSRSARHREEPVSFVAGGERLVGTVLIPAGPGPHPAAVVLFGAAGGQRDFARLQVDPLLAAGLAVLIYDKRGHGRSSGAPDPSIFDQADAAEAGWSLLAGRVDIDSGRIGIAGFSNGMWSAVMVAARRPEVAFIAGIGAPGVSMAESEVHRRTRLLRDAGVGFATLASVGAAWRCIFDIVAHGDSPDVVSQLAQALREIEHADDLRNYDVPDFMRVNPMLSPIPPSLPLDDFVAMLSAERDPQVAYDPAPDYAQVRCPVLLQYGADDTSVPVAESVAAIRLAAATRPAREQPTIIVYPELEHMLNIVPTDLVGLSGEEATVQFHHFRFGSAVWPDLIGWLRTYVNPV